jgi:hypothetical protein
MLLFSAYSAIKYFFSATLSKPWELTGIPRVKKQTKLAPILSKEEAGHDKAECASGDRHGRRGARELRIARQAGGDGVVPRPKRAQRPAD